MVGDLRTRVLRGPGDSKAAQKQRSMAREEPESVGGGEMAGLHFVHLMNSPAVSYPPRRKAGNGSSRLHNRRGHLRSPRSSSSESGWTDRARNGVNPWCPLKRAGLIDRKKGKRAGRLTDTFRKNGLMAADPVMKCFQVGQCCYFSSRSCLH